MVALIVDVAADEGPMSMAAPGQPQMPDPLGQRLTMQVSFSHSTRFVGDAMARCFAGVDRSTGRGAACNTWRGIAIIGERREDLPDGVSTGDDQRRVASLAARRGQMRAVDRMLSEGDDCRAVITQLSAAINALEQAGVVLLTAGMRWCLEDPERSAAEGYDIADVQKLFAKLT